VTLYWDEAKEVARVARQTGRVFQCGAQSASNDTWWQAQRIIQGGGIGPVIWSQTGAFRNDPKGDWNWPIGNARPGVDLDWDMWLGHRFGLAPKMPYDPERFFRFRKYWDYSGGLATDLLYHSLSHLLIGLGPEFPTRIVATGHNSVHTLENDRREVPDNFHTLVDYPRRHTVQMAATQENDDGVAELIRGQMATLRPGGPGLIIHPQEPFREKLLEMTKSAVYEGAEVIMGKGRDGRERLEEIRVPRKPRPNHMENFLECIRSREKPTLNADLAYQVMVPIALSVRAFRENRVMLFDPEKEAVPGERGPVRPWNSSTRARR
jgi:predicted dehydrogenase